VEEDVYLCPVGYWCQGGQCLIRLCLAEGRCLAGVRCLVEIQPRQLLVEARCLAESVRLQQYPVDSGQRRQYLVASVVQLDQHLAESDRPIDLDHCLQPALLRLRLRCSHLLRRDPDRVSQSVRGKGRGIGLRCWHFQRWRSLHLHLHSQHLHLRCRHSH